MSSMDAKLLERVCVEVLGWGREGKGWHTRPEHRPSLDHPGSVINDWGNKGEHDYLIDPTDDAMRVSRCGCPSTTSLPEPDGNLLLRVVEAMQSRGFGDWTIMRENEINRVTVCFGPGEGAMADDPVTATCLAALRALEVER